PAQMAEAFAKAIDAGQLAASAVPMEPRDLACPSTPLFGQAELS
ncbi:MAG: thiazole synthase, partial [Gammaproteobacteria bacterium]|nr:thiazole synthase [Gammaproteobacteria bacterium]